MWVLKRASHCARHVPELSRPKHDRTCRNALDWLRLEFMGVEGPLPHWCHSWAAHDDDSEYSSDQDDYHSSDQDEASDRSYDLEDDGYNPYMCYQCPYHPDRRHPSAEMCRCAANDPRLRAHGHATRVMHEIR
eukprot:3898922-Prymnesium_polylepis.2